MAFDDSYTHIGTRNHCYAGEVPFGVGESDRLRHTHIIGQTGTGKSTLLKNLILQDIHAGRGCALIDPHGDLARDLLDHIPPARMRDVVYFNPSDLAHPPAFNLLQAVPPDERDRVTANIVGTFRYLWADTWGSGRMQYIFKNTVAALLDYPSYSGTTLLGVPRMYSDPEYRRRIVEQIRSPSVRCFWEQEYRNYSKGYEAEAVAPIQNKVGQFLLSTVLRNILGQVKSTIDPAFIMNNRRIFIANLSKGELGDDDANLLGSLLVTAFQTAAVNRASIPEESRGIFHLFLDEFHCFTTEAFTSILSEARKYGLSLTLAHQYLDQMQDEVRSAVLGNVGTILCFRIGGTDARELAPHLSPLSATTLEELSNGEVGARILVDGEPQTFIGRTHVPQFARYGRGDRLIAYSRSRYTRPRSQVEGKIVKWLRG